MSISETNEHVTAKGLQNSSARLLPKDTVCLSRTASVGYVVLMGREMATSQDFVNWICSDGLSPEFLKHLFLAEGKNLLRFASGAVHKTIYFPEAKAFFICHPDRPEQDHIVAFLDEALGQVLRARRLVETNKVLARSLFETYRQVLLGSRRPSWFTNQLGAICEVSSGGTPQVSNKKYWNGDVPWYSSGELNETFTASPERYISRLGLECSNAKLFPRGSLLIGMYDTAALKMSILDREAAFNQAIAGVKPNSTLDLEFVLHAISARKTEILKQRRGVRQKNLSLAKIRAISIFVPPTRTEQRALVTQLETLRQLTERLEDIYVRKLTALDELRSSLLSMAFRGEIRRPSSSVATLDARERSGKEKKIAAESAA
jgi:type I restriction enzyme S subunit